MLMASFKTQSILATLTFITIITAVLTEKDEVTLSICGSVRDGARRRAESAAALAAGRRGGGGDDAVELFLEGRTGSIGAVGTTGVVRLADDDDDGSFLTAADNSTLLDEGADGSDLVCETEIVACAVCRLRLSWDASRTIPDATDADRAALSDLARACTTTTASGHRGSGRNAAPCLDVQLIEEPAALFSLGVLARRPYRQVSLLSALDSSAANFTSSAYKLLVRLRVRNVHRDDRMLRYVRRLFPLKLETIDNTVTLRGRASPHEDLPTLTSEGAVASPRYPRAYPSGVQINYTFVSDDPDGRVRVQFEDFQIHLMSQLKVFDSNGAEMLNSLGRYGGPKGRPPPLQSTGANLTLIFTGNSYTQEIGFRAKYKFVRGENTWFNKPTKDCDAVFDGFGASITIASQGLPVNAYVDCLWVLGKSSFGAFEFNRLYVKVQHFAVRSNPASIRLTVRGGRTSVSPTLLDIFGAKSDEELARDQPHDGFVTDMSPHGDGSEAADGSGGGGGFYIRLRGYLASYSGLKISFAQFYRWSSAMCRNPADYHCHNGRCIKAALKCDQMDHCGDLSDEYLTGHCAGPDGNPITGGGVRTGGGYGGVHDGGDYRGGGADAGLYPGRDGGGRVGQGAFRFTNLLFLIAGVILVVLVLLLLAVVVARVYKQRLITRFRREVAAASSGPALDMTGGGDGVRHPGPHAHYEDVGARPGPSVQHIGERRFYVLPEREVSIFEAPPTYDDALKHPAVPPNAVQTALFESSSRQPVTSASTSTNQQSPPSIHATPQQQNTAATVYHSDVRPQASFDEGVENRAFVADVAVLDASSLVQPPSPASNSTAQPTSDAPQSPSTVAVASNIVRPTVILPVPPSGALVVQAAGPSQTHSAVRTGSTLSETTEDDDDDGLSSSSSAASSDDDDDDETLSNAGDVSGRRRGTSAGVVGAGASSSASAHHRLTDILKWAKHKVGGATVVAEHASVAGTDAPEVPSEVDVAATNDTRPSWRHTDVGNDAAVMEPNARRHTVPPCAAVLSVAGGTVIVSPPTTPPRVSYPPPERESRV